MSDQITTTWANRLFSLSHNSPIRQFLTTPEGNYIKATLAVLLVGSTYGLLEKTVRVLWSRLEHMFVVSITIDSKDESYGWILEWLSQHPYSQKATSLSLTSVYDSEHGSNTENPRPRILLSPAIGSHFLRYKGHFYWFSRERDTNANDMTNGGFYESITITLFGRNRNAVKRLIKDAMDVAFERDENKLLIYTNSSGSWSRFGRPRIPRPLSTVILEEATKTKILNDVKEFFDSCTWYREMGIPYRRGYLLHGFPGTGKSSFIKALAGELKMNLCLVSLSDRELDDEQLNSLLNDAPPRSILLLEDIDAAFVSREESRTSNVTFSGLLNALDGVGSQEGRIVFMTTNHVSQLDPALIRPGRIDVISFFGLATSYQIGKLFERFYPTVDSKLVQLFVSAVPDQSITMADLQGFLLEHKNNPLAAIEEVDEWLKHVQKHPTAGDPLSNGNNSARNHESTAVVA